MKNMTTIMMLIVTFIIFPGICGNMQNHYIREGFVTTIEKDDYITIEDNTGNLWDIDFEDDYQIGDRVIMKMFTNYTDTNIYDDEIVKVYKKDVDK